jgi:hypothetical protein
MDGSHFDALTQKLAVIRFTRKSALRGLVGGFAALTGGAVFTGGVEAGKKKWICHCGTGPTCTDEQVSRTQRNAHLRDHQCDYRGECRDWEPIASTACAAAPIPYSTDTYELSCVPNSTGYKRTCFKGSGLECVPGPGYSHCQPIDLGRSCTNNGECSTGRCEGGKCVNCPDPSTCGDTFQQCCTPLATCQNVNGNPRCVLS